MNLIRVKVEGIEFAAARDYECVYGRDLAKRFKGSAYSVYVELGEEKEYIYKEYEDQSSKRKFFKKCNIFYAESDEKADKGEFISDKEHVVDVILYV
jgi:hypothetical protein